MTDGTNIATTGYETERKSMVDALFGSRPKNYSQPALDQQRLEQMSNMISEIRVGDQDSRYGDVLGGAYEHFLSRLANAEAKGGGDLRAPDSVVRLLVQTIEQCRGRVCDPGCGSSLAGSGQVIYIADVLYSHHAGSHLLQG